MSRRVDSEILQRTFEENLSDFESSRFSDFRVRFEALRTELRDAGNIPLTYLEPLSRLDKEDDDDNNDIDHDRIEEHAEWQAILRPYVSNGETWLSAPWCITEFLVYRKLMECLDYFEPSSSTYRYDPFRNQKEAALVSSVEAAEGALGRIAVLPTNDMDTLGAAVALSLWGNRMDLSLWPVDTTDKLPPSKSLSSLPASTAFAGVLEDASSNLLHDDTSLLTERCNILRGMNGGTGGDVDIIVDNAGFELVTDLALADHLINSGVARTVTFQLKSHPTFVSDAMTNDLIATVRHYTSSLGTRYPHCASAGERWTSHLESGRWIANEDRFWVQPSPMWEMTSSLRSDMVKRCDLAFVKGDANYRRLLGDRSWDLVSDSFQDVVGSYFPCPVCALRTLKAEVGCGMEGKKVEMAKKISKDWLVEGRFGVVHYGTGYHAAGATTEVE